MYIYLPQKPNQISKDKNMIILFLATISHELNVVGILEVVKLKLQHKMLNQCTVYIYISSMHSTPQVKRGKNDGEETKSGT